MKALASAVDRSAKDELEMAIEHHLMGEEEEYDLNQKHRTKDTAPAPLDGDGKEATGSKDATRMS